MTLSGVFTDQTMSLFHVEIHPDDGRQGDAIYFDSRLPHTIMALGSRPARMLACLVNVYRAAAGESPQALAH